jgi:sulfite reductase (NADPH) flavoprotein alpha-component
LKARAANGAGPNWLIFGERNGAIDYHYRAELEIWQRDGILEKLDAVFSRDQPERRYVQQRLLEVGAEVREWINRGAAIYVCGSLRGMAGGVDEALTTLLGQSALDELSLSGRYRRDVY